MRIYDIVFGVPRPTISGGGRGHRGHHGHHGHRGHGHHGHDHRGHRGGGFILADYGSFPVLVEEQIVYETLRDPASGKLWHRVSDYDPFGVASWIVDGVTVRSGRPF